MWYDSGTECGIEFDKGFMMVNSERLSFGKEDYVFSSQARQTLYGGSPKLKVGYCYLNLAKRPL